MSRRLGRIVIVGASLAGLRTAEALRRLGHDGELTIVGAERRLPYDRPPLSKQFLDGSWSPDQVRLSTTGDVGARWELGTPAVALDRGERLVRLGDGRTIRYDGLVVATGARAREWPGGPPPAGVFTLRTLDDALQLRQRLQNRDSLLVVGGGFLAGEVAAAARRHGGEVTLVHRARLPLQSVAGHQVGTFVRGLHEEAGVRLSSETNVQSFIVDRRGSLEGAMLTDDREVRASVAVVALGAEPNSEWLARSGLLTNRGLVCDPYLRPILADGTPATDIVAAGDVVRWPHPLTGGRLFGSGHWTNAVQQAEAAAGTLLAVDEPIPFRPVPSFWSDLHGTQLRSVGLPALGTPELVEYDATRRRMVVSYHRDGELVGAVTANRTSRLASYRGQLTDRLRPRQPV